MQWSRIMQQGRGMERCIWIREYKKWAKRGMHGLGIAAMRDVDGINPWTLSGVSGIAASMTGKVLVNWSRGSLDWHVSFRKCSITWVSVEKSACFLYSGLARVHLLFSWWHDSRFLQSDSNFNCSVSLKRKERWHLVSEASHLQTLGQDWE